MTDPLPTATSSIPAAARTRQSHLDVIARLQRSIDEALAPSLPALRAGPYALLDMPNHSNVGDSAIWAGEIAWLLKNVGAPPAYVGEHNATADELNAYIRGNTILLHGGGNFGDVWPNFQEFREHVIQGYPQAHIVQMPQSIHFDEEAALERTAAALRKAHHLRLLVRDQESYDLAAAHFGCEVTLCPDMAFALGPLDRLGTPDLDVLLLLRTDKESRQTTAQVQGLPERWEQADWLDDDPDMHRRALLDTRLSSVLGLSVRKLSKMWRRRFYYDTVSSQRMARGIKLLSRARFVITDRLHVHILSTLMGLPHCFLDNHYGKISRFSAAFDTRWVDSHHAKSMPEAVACARAWLAEAEAA